jgi:formamidase
MRRLRLDPAVPLRDEPGTGHNRWHPGIQPILTVTPGESFTLETRDGLDAQIQPGSESADINRIDLGLGHPLSGPVYIEDAEPGDLLEVELSAYETGSFGFTAIVPGFGLLGDLFDEPHLVKWSVDEQTAETTQMPEVRIANRTFAGVIGVAPSSDQLARYEAEEARLGTEGAVVPDPAPEAAIPTSATAGLRTIPPRANGGNMDMRQLRAGSRIFLTVEVPGALLSVGDLHYCQGDGEVCGTALEIPGAVTMRVSVHRTHGRTTVPNLTCVCPEQESGPTLTTIGFAQPVNGRRGAMDFWAGSRAALLEMLELLDLQYGLERENAYALCSVAADLRISEAVNVPYGLVSCSLPLSVLADSPERTSGLALHPKPEE